MWTVEALHASLSTATSNTCGAVCSSWKGDTSSPPRQKTESVSEAPALSHTDLSPVGQNRDTASANKELSEAQFATPFPGSRIYLKVRLSFPLLSLSIFCSSTGRIVVISIGRPNTVVFANASTLSLCSDAFSSALHVFGHGIILSSLPCVLHRYSIARKQLWFVVLQLCLFRWWFPPQF